MKTGDKTLSLGDDLPNVRLKPADYLTKKRKAERANHVATQKSRGTYISPHQAMENTLKRMVESIRSEPPLELQKHMVSKACLELREMLAKTMTTMSDYDEYRDHDALKEVRVALDRARSALLDLPRMAREASKL